MELARAVGAARPAGPAAARCPQAKPRTAAVRPAGRRPSRVQRLPPVHAAATAQTEGLAAWLAAAGLDAAKQAVAAGAGGLVCARPVKAGEQLFVVPAAAWITAETAAQSDIGQHLQGLEPWLAVALFLLHERAKGAASRWAPYLAALPADSGSPLQWSEEDLKELQGSQALQTAMAYKAYFQQRYERLQAEVLQPNRQAFDPEVFSFDAFLWAACTVRARSHAPLDGANLALVPLADMTQHQCGARSSGWQVRQVGGLFGAGAAPALVMEAAAAMEAGEAVAMDFGPQKTDGQVLVDHGVLDPLINKASYALTLELSEEERNFDDKIDILETNGMQQATEFVLRADAAPDAGLLPLLRLLNLSGADCFLLESIFRNEVWEHMQLPISEENERACYQQLIDGCNAALAGYPTTIDEDLALLNGGSLPTGSRRAAAVRVRLGEKEALDATLRYFEDRIGRLNNMEYYAERRLKRLGLLDDQGKTTWDGFFEDGIA
ncbi:fructose-bisphosphate aldolase-lysine N- chloroplastic [Chlorella sorokiniana]|uniref:Fructose-bisphosphate aldolase-lysine N-chloroplastic n=1 Tax=Chlorella sorokiniana TaxID=3076 RepID=A0A2P6TNY5_CHLSO|nr:fructose-bisphosphate aldolase-lysine N- chloroplastic [Chlorella sorokiniana]|eukprot:PRW51051.1 fructose-bisphosphate aldolase-lysine N- chloroplastic [Chlorella sorokiniana]